jgi:hypothetical protein
LTRFRGWGCFGKIGEGSAGEAEGDEEDGEQDGGGSDGGVGQEIDEGVIQAEGEEGGAG